MRLPTISPLALWAAAATALFPLSAREADAAESVARFGEWIAYRALSDKGAVCAFSSKPQASDPPAEGGGAAFVVTRREGRHEVALRLTKPLRGGKAEIRIGEARYPLIGGDERNPRWAWAANPEDERLILRDMKKGDIMRVKASFDSARAHWARYSLRGVTAAMAFLEKRCASDRPPRAAESGA